MPTIVSWLLWLSRLTYRLLLLLWHTWRRNFLSRRLKYNKFNKLPCHENTNQRTVYIPGVFAEDSDFHPLKTPNIPNFDAAFADIEDILVPSLYFENPESFESTERFHPRFSGFASDLGVVA